MKVFLGVGGMNGVWTDLHLGRTCDKADTCVSLLSCSVCPIMRPSVDSVCVRCRLVLVLALVLVLVLVCPTAGYNLDQEHSLEFTGPSSSMFGYSVLLHHYGAHKWSGFILFCSSDSDL